MSIRRVGAPARPATQSRQQHDTYGVYMWYAVVVFCVAGGGSRAQSRQQHATYIVKIYMTLWYVVVLLCVAGRVERNYNKC